MTPRERGWVTVGVLIAVTVGMVAVLMENLLFGDRTRWPISVSIVGMMYFIVVYIRVSRGPATTPREIIIRHYGSTRNFYQRIAVLTAILVGGLVAFYLLTQPNLR